MGTWKLAGINRAARKGLPIAYNHGNTVSQTADCLTPEKTAGWCSVGMLTPGNSLDEFRERNDRVKTKHRLRGIHNYADHDERNRSHVTQVRDLACVPSL